VDIATALSRVVPIVSSAPADRVAYARDLWPRALFDVREGRVAPHQPAAIAWPTSSAEVSALVRFARAESVPLVPFGAGSGVCGGVVPDARAVIVDLKRMTNWRIDARAPLLDVGPGAMGITLEEDVEREGYTIGHFPSSILCSTIGGWIAARGAGQCSGLYGKIEDMVVALEVVLGDGEVVELQRRRSAPDLTPLFIGSEGTLGVVTRAKLRLHPKPVARHFAAFSFPDIVAGWNAMRLVFQQGLRPAVARLYDPIDSSLMRRGSVKPAGATPARRTSSERRGRAERALLSAALRVPLAVNAAIHAAEGRLLGGSTLVLVFEGAAAHVSDDGERARTLCEREGGEALGEAPARKWYEHRYSVSYRQSPVFRMGAFSDTMEVAAPWSRLESLYSEVRRALGRHVVVMAHLSHAYPDGCSIYFTFSAAARDDAAARRRYDRAWHDALGAAIAAGGTLSHHHGVGRSKAPRLGEELGFGVEVVRRLMRACDPDGVMNPGNLVPRERASNARLGAPGPAAGDIDETSLLATVSGSSSLAQVESLLSEHGLTLELTTGVGAEQSVATWIARGLPGATDPWSDPVDHHVAGLKARLGGGEELIVHPAPRRAVGPDLVALFSGCSERVGAVENATLRVHRRGEPAARALPFDADRDPRPNDGEARLWDRVARALSEP
jgi:alkyldihydroxyacetonephosphate synthase